MDVTSMAPKTAPWTSVISLLVPFATTTWPTVSPGLPGALASDRVEPRHVMKHNSPPASTARAMPGRQGRVVQGLGASTSEPRTVTSGGSAVPW